MACLGMREIVSQKAAGSQIHLLPGRGCSDGPELCVGRRQSGWVSVGEETRARKSKGVCQSHRVGECWKSDLN